MKDIKWLFVFLLLIGIIVFSVFNEGKSKKEEVKNMTGKHNVLISIKNYGDIKVEVDADIAPISANQFMKLANDGFYNGLTFHRIIKGFMIQGGAPGMNSKEVEKIKGEFSSNGVENNISHVRGVISMARANDPNSASSQFFIVQEDSTYLDGNYAGFGLVTEGMEVVDKIVEDVAGKALNNNGMIGEDDQPVIDTIKVLD